MAALESFIDEGLEQNDVFMIAQNTGSLEIVKPFTANGPGLKRRCAGSRKRRPAGDSLKRSKRYLKRTVYNEEIFPGLAAAGWVLVRHHQRGRPQRAHVLGQLGAAPAWSRSTTMRQLEARSESGKPCR